jgi:hypothetical protein
MARYSGSEFADSFKKGMNKVNQSEEEEFKSQFSKCKKDMLKDFDEILRLRKEGDVKALSRRYFTYCQSRRFWSCDVGGEKYCSLLEDKVKELNKSKDFEGITFNFRLNNGVSYKSCYIEVEGIQRF